MENDSSAFWSVPAAELLQRLQSSAQGLTGEAARQRLERYGLNLTTRKKQSNIPALLLAQFKSPIILILLFAAILSFFLRENTNAIIIVVIIFVSGLLGF